MTVEKLSLHTDPKRMLPNVYMSQALKASRDLLGEDGFKAVINRAGVILPEMTIYHMEEKWPPPTVDLGIKASHYSTLFRAIEEAGGGRAQLVDIGIRTASMGFEGLGPAMKTSLTILKKLPGFRWRAGVVLKAMADDLMDVFPDDRKMNTITFEEDDEKKVFRFTDRTGDSCWGRKGQAKPVCHVYRGGIIGAIQMATGQKAGVKEVSCMACDDPACVFEIDFEQASKT
jgi:predicted hydrocarbon binding protein